MKTSVIVILVGILGFMLGYGVSEINKNKVIAKELELISKNLFVFESSQKTDILMHVYEKYNESEVAGEDYLKKYLFMSYESLIFTDKLKFLDEKEFLLGKTEKAESILINDPISECVSVEKDKILECYRNSLSGK